MKISLNKKRFLFGGIFIITLILVFVCFGILHKVLAAVYGSQLDFSSHIQDNSGDVFHVLGLSSGNSSTGNIYLKVKFNSAFFFSTSHPEWYWHFYSCTDSACNHPTHLGCFPENGSSCHIQVFDENDNDVSDAGNVPAGDYYFKIPNANFTSGLYYGMLSASNSIEMDWKSNNVPVPYYIYSDTAQIDSLAINSPMNEATTTDFAVFKGHLHDSQYTYSQNGWQTMFYVCYGLNQTAVNNCSASYNPPAGVYIDTTQSFATTDIDFEIPKMKNLFLGTYYEKMVAYKRPYANGVGDWQFIVDSPEASFTIISGGYQINSSSTWGYINASGTYQHSLYSPTSTSIFNWEETSSIFYVDCSSYNNVGFFSSSTLGMLGCQMKKTAFGILGALFEPSINISQWLFDSWAKIQSAFPFNIVFGTLNALKTQATLTASSTPSDIVLNIQPNASLSNFHWVMLSSTTLDQAMGTSTKTAVWNFIGYSSHLILIAALVFTIL